MICTVLWDPSKYGSDPLHASTAFYIEELQGFVLSGFLELVVVSAAVPVVGVVRATLGKCVCTEGVLFNYDHAILGVRGEGYAAIRRAYFDRACHSTYGITCDKPLLASVAPAAVLYNLLIRCSKACMMPTLSWVPARMV